MYIYIERERDIYIPASPGARSFRLRAARCSLFAMFIVLAYLMCCFPLAYVYIYIYIYVYVYIYI